MLLILAVEPDSSQAAKVKALARSTLRAELVAVETVLDAIEVLATRVPDLILTSTLLSPRDEGLLTARLRELAAAGLPVQALVIPLLATTTRRSRRHDGSGLFSRLRRSRVPLGPVDDGCEPAVFAGQIEEYLDRAAADRANVAERDEPVYPDFTPEPTAHEHRIEPVQESKKWMGPVEKPPLEEGTPSIPAYERWSPETEPLSYTTESFAESPGPVAEPHVVDRGEALLTTSVSHEKAESIFDESESPGDAGRDFSYPVATESAQADPEPYELLTESFAESPAPVAEPHVVDRGAALFTTSVSHEEAESIFDESESPGDAGRDFSYPVATESAQADPEPLELLRDAAADEADEDEPRIGLQSETASQSVTLAGGSSPDLEEVSTAFSVTPVAAATESAILHTEAVVYGSEQANASATEDSVTSRDPANDRWEPLDFMGDNLEEATEPAGGDLIEEDDQNVIVLPLDLASFADDLDTYWRTAPESEISVAQTDADHGTTTLVDFAAGTLEPRLADVSEEPTPDLVTEESDTWRIDSRDTSFPTDSSTVDIPSLAPIPDLEPTGPGEPTEAPMGTRQEAVELDTGEQVAVYPVEPAEPEVPAEPGLSGLPEQEPLPVESSTAEEAPEVTIATPPEPEPDVPPAPAVLEHIEELVEGLTQPTPTANTPAIPAAIAAATSHVEVIEMLAPVRSDFDQLRDDAINSVAAVGSSDSDNIGVSTERVESFMDIQDDVPGKSESGSADGARGTARRTLAKTAPSTPKTARLSARTKKKKRKRKNPSPMEERNFFDPDQCAFAALLEKLEEVTEVEVVAQGAD